MDRTLLALSSLKRSAVAHTEATTDVIAEDVRIFLDSEPVISELCDYLVTLSDLVAALDYHAVRIGELRAQVRDVLLGALDVHVRDTESAGWDRLAADLYPRG